MDGKTLSRLRSGSVGPTSTCGTHAPARTFLLLALLAAGAASHGQEVIVNGDFDSDLSGWTTFGAPAPIWASFDQAGAPSGSALLSNTAAGPDEHLVRLSQCFVPSRPGRYQFSAHGYIPAGQASGRLFVVAVIYSGGGCTGPGGGPGAYLPATIGAWVQQTGLIEVSTDEIALPVSMSLSLGIEKTPAGGSIEAYVDAARLIYDPVFADGFEQVP